MKSEIKKFFILSLGRSGTTFLAELLNKDPNAFVLHEPYELDKQIIFYRYAGVFSTILDKFLQERFSKLFSQVEGHKIYGECNSYLRYEVDWLKTQLNANLIFLTRDGRDFVRSAYTRKVLTALDHQQSIVPRDNDPYAEKWHQLDRFEKLCWYWRHTNEFLFSKLMYPVHFEKLINNYDYFKEKILKPTGGDISYDVWEREVKKPKNTSKKESMIKTTIKQILLYRKDTQEIHKPIPPCQMWDKNKTNKFWEICGETMTKLGYKD